MIGGSIWRISTAVGEDVVYAVDYNHRKELHLNSTALAGLFSRPALMIADADRQVAVNVMPLSALFTHTAWVHVKDIRADHACQLQQYIYIQSKAKVLFLFLGVNIRNLSRFINRYFEARVPYPVRASFGTCKYLCATVCQACLPQLSAPLLQLGNVCPLQLCPYLSQHCHNS